MKMIRIGLVLLCLLAVGCGGEITAFECNTSDNCDKDSNCVEGKCIKQDNDKDGWAKGKDCDDNNASVYPGAPEICGNNVDDNCNKKIDTQEPCLCKDGDERPCGKTDQGECSKGIQRCVEGIWGKCSGEKLPAAKESCNGLDDDCDGKADEGLNQEECYTGPTGAKGKGACRTGFRSCLKGIWSECKGEVKPKNEACNNEDDDCNGKVDDALERQCYTGSPQNTQGVGICKTGKQTCENGSWKACRGEVLPQKETCNGQDDNCNGKTDEGLKQDCYSGPQGTKDKGTCQSGQQTCNNGTWGTCTGEVKPTTETCNNKDDDCDGKVDGIRQACGGKNTQGKGACKSGQQLCTSGKWGACTGEVKPTTETCNNKDDDCDGKVDESLKQACYTGPANTRKKGACQDGTQTCQAGKWGTCSGEVKPTAETCNNKDDDCDGKVDESLQQACYTGPATTRKKGACQDGTQTCQAGQWGACSGEVKPTAETCNNKDDDCDGKVDESLQQACYTGPATTRKKGACQDGTQTCQAGQWGACSGEVKPTAETCNNKDDDCDGKVDENLQQACYTGPANTRKKGACQDGTQTCQAGQWGTCSGEVKPTTETCNNKDDNCDGKVDENLTKTCYTGKPGTQGKGICRSGTQVCTNGKYGACSGEVTPQTESCTDNLDNNCDGSVNEGCNQVVVINSNINTDNGQIDGKLSPGWKGNGRFEIKSDVRFPTNTVVKVTGSQPLLLVVTGKIEVLGTIDARGQAGGSITCQSPGGAAAGQPGPGGSGGGQGGSCNINGLQQPKGGAGQGAGGGKGGQGVGIASFSTATGGGGGGAGHSTKGKNGTSGVTAGAGGASYGSATTLLGGSGGGGGGCGAFILQGLLKVFTPGSGGGGGGGAVKLEATRNIQITGNILTNGGDGGNNVLCSSIAGGGGGGAGSGGFIWIRTQTNLTVNSSATLRAQGGKGKGLAGFLGGNGASGRIRLEDADGVVSYNTSNVTPTPTLAKY